jgi:hypothetical protein
MTRTDTPVKRNEPGEAYEPYDPAASGTRGFAPRGRHRKPRPRKVLLAAGGLALAAGVLSLVRLSSGPGPGDLGTVEAGPRPDPAAGTERATTTAATVAPEVSPSAPAALGSLSPTPTTAGTRPAPAPYATTTVRTPAPAAPDATTVPDTRTTPPPAPTATTGDAPRPAQTPPPSRTTPAPTPKPDEPGLCVPVVGVCVDPLDRND